MSILITKQDCERGRYVRLRDGSTDSLMSYSSTGLASHPVLCSFGHWYGIDGKFSGSDKPHDLDIVRFDDEEIIVPCDRKKEIEVKKPNILPGNKSKKRKIIQISGDSIPGHGDYGANFSVYALCDDGTAWEYGGSKCSWTKLPDIPQDDAEGEKK